MLALRTFIGPVPLLSSGNAKGNKTCPLHLWSTGQESRMKSETVAQWGNCYNGRIHHVILEQGWIEILWKEEGRMAKKNKKGFNCELWNDRILKENKYFPNREGRKGILDRRNSLCKGVEAWETTAVREGMSFSVNRGKYGSNYQEIRLQRCIGPVVWRALPATTRNIKLMCYACPKWGSVRSQSREMQLEIKI